MSLLHSDDDFVRGFPHAARARAAASRFRQRGTLHVQHVNTRHIPDPASGDDYVEQFHARTCDERPWEPDDYPRGSAFGDTPGNARATRRWLAIYIVAVVVVTAFFA